LKAAFRYVKKLLEKLKRVFLKPNGMTTQIDMMPKEFIEVVLIKEVGEIHLKYP